MARERPAGIRDAVVPQGPRAADHDARGTEDSEQEALQGAVLMADCGLTQPRYGTGLRYGTGIRYGSGVRENPDSCLHFEVECDAMVAATIETETVAAMTVEAEAPPIFTSEVVCP